MVTKKAEKNNLFASFENQWVGLSPDRKNIIASGKTLKELDEKLKKLNDEDAIFTKVVSFDQVLIP